MKEAAMTTTTHSLAGWDIARAADVEWTPWGADGNARAKVLSNADGYFVVLVEADAGYTGTEHEHANAEFLYVLDGSLRNQGRTMVAGDAFAAAAGSVHSDFEAEVPARYLTIFRL
jgi:quercetin dioxygenase-like cupin family protein